MTLHLDRRNWIWAVPVLAASAGVFAAVGVAAPPARADSINDSFLSALNNAGVGYDDPANAVNLGQSICPMLSEPGGNFASVASRMAGNDGISADVSGLFASIAISMYCPSMMADFANGDWLQDGKLPGLPFPISGLLGNF